MVLQAAAIEIQGELLCIACVDQQEYSHLTCIVNPLVAVDMEAKCPECGNAFGSEASLDAAEKLANEAKASLS